MKIEITDREYWLEKVNKGIDHIQSVGKEADAEYEKQWRKGWLWFKDAPDTAFPPYQQLVYPSMYQCFSFMSLREFRSALLTKNTGSIFVDIDTIQAAEDLSK